MTISSCVTQRAEIKKLSLIPHEDPQISRSVTTGYFDYRAALSLRQMALTAGVGLPDYLLAPEIGLLLPYLPNLKQRLFVDTLWNTGARLNECLALMPSNFQLDDERGEKTGQAVCGSRNAQAKEPWPWSSQKGRTAKTDRADYVNRLREYFETFRQRKYEPIWNVASDETPRNWIRAAVKRAARDDVTFSLPTITPKTFRHSFSMHLIQYRVPLKVVQSYMGHAEIASTEVYTKVFALDVGSQREVRFTVPVGEVQALRLYDKDR